ncbi:MAG TPA: hypothetical protein VKK79_00760 [Candidatus Lokiarchaeia archaeon]|nr:hypothetical protein [Candidatus Lokiarchaeia archaeon]
MAGQPFPPTFFVIDATTAQFTPSLSLKDLTVAGKRVDVICRAALAALWWGETLLQHVTFIAAFKHHAALFIEGTSLPASEFPRTELRLAHLLREVFAGRETLVGINFVDKTFGEIIRELLDEGTLVWWLDEEGPLVENLFAPGQAIAFVLGDHVGMSEEFLAEFATTLPRVSLGPRSYLGSACIQLVLSRQIF